MKTKAALRMAIAGTMILAGLIFFFTDRTTHPVPYNKVHEPTIEATLEQVNDIAVEEIEEYDDYDVLGVGFFPEGKISLKVQTTMEVMDEDMHEVIEKVKHEAMQVMQAYDLETLISRDIEVEVHFVNKAGETVGKH